MTTAKDQPMPDTTPATDAAGRPIHIGDTVGGTTSGRYQATIIGTLASIGKARVRVDVADSSRGTSGFGKNTGEQAQISLDRVFLVADGVGAVNRLARIAEAHSKDQAPHGMTSGDCAECGHPWPCPTYTWATTDRDPLANWDPADDEPEADRCPAGLLPIGDAPAERCVVEGPHEKHVTATGKRWTEAAEDGAQ